MAAEPIRVWNPPNPYLTEHRDLIGEPEFLRVASHAIGTGCSDPLTG